MTKHILVSKPGNDVLKYRYTDDFYLDSDYPVLKIHEAGTFSTGINGVQLINHNLGYKPFVLVFSQFVGYDGFNVTISTEYYPHDWLIEGASTEFYGYTQIYDDRIVITVGNTQDGGTPGIVNGFYYIFKDRI